MMDSLYFSSFCVFVVIFYICFRAYKLYEFRNTKTYPPGPFGLPIVGHLPFLDKHPEHTFTKWRKIYGDIFRIRMGHWNTVVLNGYNVIKAAADFDDDVFSDRFNFASFKLQVEVNRGIHVLASCPFDDTFLQSRKTTATALRLMANKRNTLLTNIVSMSADSFCSNLIAKGTLGPVSVNDDINRAIGTILYKVIYGRGQNETHVDERVAILLNMTKELNQIATSGNSVDAIPWLRHLIPSTVAKFKKALELYRDFDDGELLVHKETFISDKIEDVTEYLIEYEIKQKDRGETEDNTVCQVLYNNLKDMFDAGVGTSSSTLQWLILFMIAYPDDKRNVQREIDEIVGRDKNVQLDDKENLHYTMAIIHECWRLVSLVPFALPHKTLSDTRFLGFDIDEGTHVMFNVHSIYNDDAFWGDPEIFHPERILNEFGRLDKQKCNRIVPFSLGRRRCVGESLARMQVFALFANLLQRCELTKPYDVVHVIDLTPVPGLIYFPKHFNVIVKDRRLKE